MSSFRVMDYRFLKKLRSSITFLTFCVKRFLVRSKKIRGERFIIAIGVWKNVGKYDKMWR
jgi:hypothetical protein